VGDEKKADNTTIQEAGKKRPKKKILVVGLGLLAFGLVYLFVSYNRTPSNGIINNDAIAQTNTKQSEPQNRHYTGTAVSIEYPEEYGDIHNNPPSGLVVEQFSLVANKGITDTRNVGITVKRKDAGVVMREDAAYKLRMADQAHFTASMVTVGDNTAEQFIKHDGSEITFFIDSPKYYVTISGTTGTSRQQLSDDMNLIVGNFKWLK